MTYKEKTPEVDLQDTPSKRNKRQIYLWDINKEWYDGLKNKSRTLNLLMQQHRKSIE